MATFDEAVAEAAQVDDEIATYIGTLQSDLATAQADLATANGQVATLQAEDAAQQAQVDQLTAETAKLKALLPTTSGGTGLTLAAQTVNATTGQPLNAAVVVTGGTGPYTFAQSGLQADLALDTLGNLTGTPAAPGTSSFTVTATDSTGATASGTVTVVTA